MLSPDDALGVEFSPPAGNTRASLPGVFPIVWFNSYSLSVSIRVILFVSRVHAGKLVKNRVVLSPDVTDRKRAPEYARIADKTTLMPDDDSRDTEPPQRFLSTRSESTRPDFPFSPGRNQRDCTQLHDTTPSPARDGKPQCRQFTILAFAVKGPHCQANSVRLLISAGRAPFFL